jgi:hypothetical protein
VVRFTKPVDLTTVKSADTFFFASRNVLDQGPINDFIANVPWQTLSYETPSMSGNGMDPASFNADKFRTPFLVAASVFDEDGSQTALRLQPRMGFYLDDRMRNPQPNEDFRYFLHLLSGIQGIRDLAGNPIDLQADSVDLADHVVIPFSIDTRSNGSQPAFDNNLAVSVVRRFASIDEDENPSYLDPTEVQPPRSAFPNARPTAYALPDVFGSVIYLDGKLLARPTSRTRKIADNLNQAPFGSQTSPLRWCPYDDAGEQQFTGNTANTAFTGGGIQNPLNPYGCRLQTVWREIDLSLSRVDPFDFNLDVEQMYWAPFQGSAITFDELDRTSLFLGHSERRPEPCVGQFSSLSTYPDSGLAPHFADNYVRNMRANSSQIESSPAPFAAYADVPLVMDASQSILEPNRVNRFLPLPQFRKPYFVYRDETVVEQGCTLSLTQAMGGITAGASPSDLSFNSTKFPWILSPYANGVGRHVARADWLRGQPPPPSGNNYPPLGSARGLSFVDSCWNSNTNYKIVGHTLEETTEGLVGNVALPLLADFWTYCDSPDLPAGNGYVALGTNGWQIAITVQSGPQPYFRCFSSGHSPPNGGGPALCVGPGTADWNQALGGYTPGASSHNVPPADNSFYWIMIDFVKRATVATAGFVDLLNPHRVRPPDSSAPPDPRLGPFFNPAAGDRLPQGFLPTFGYDIDPPVSTLPAGTAIVPQFRGAGIVDPTPWYWDNWINNGIPSNGPMYGPTDPAYAANLAAVKALLKPTADNFALDPYKAGDAHIRKFDDRNIPGTSQVRNWWTYFYNRTVTGYFQDPNQLMDPAQLQPFGGPAEGFTPRDVRYINWRLLMSNNLDTDPPIAPVIDTFTFSYRFERTH